MKCSKCGTENLNESLFCDECGTKLGESSDITEKKVEVYKESVENDESNRKKKFTKNKIILIGISLILVLVCLIGYSNYNKNKKYEETFTRTTLDILTETYSSQLMCIEISEIWRNAIDSSYKDFNTEIANKQEQWKSDGVYEERETAKINIENNMKELRNPPEEYEEVYKLFVDLYGIYGQIYRQATSPQGSIMTYNQDVNQKTSEFDQIYDKIKVLKPEIAVKSNNK
ncbi:MAG: zinc ribbon domain-containing protein [Clostridium sp.]